MPSSPAPVKPPPISGAPIPSPSPSPPRRKIDSRRNPNPNPRPSSSSGDSGWFSSDDEIYTDLFNQTSSLTLNNCDDEDDDDDDDDDDDETETLISSSFTDSSDAINLRMEVEKLTVKESFAVVKRSDDPYSDFRRSMAEMIVEKELYEPRDLEELLHCLLSLNSRHHHRAIISAFSEIWDSLFPATTAAAGEQ
ncbi:transcription repressor OFP8-like [Dioscorea cayenensis subsp. rotundata]|uniref:Transcription repressor n=1 Tax=Dioscorea cayennensis subsp. rotundata TaxID=55577 RepID=A0AB40AXP3_DIOCR|nr:transcription repressor OFP8-like [Dioscorea cayenensis subsp. rotundata]